ncbi:TetR/AcrR family transcriptional regulator [Gordonia sp. HY002]|uniref:TetR/AcrR family transcriptional regulator n=1 Tax=Gordonia zhenghanii TaxID=2911516 RepID=UPI001EF0FCF6|nr:TetR/AcrR family transcriptional regulator [Gordonia zhenghanii]MCF8571675.1 TetR/AcrR family transcriptional regulator [Gordonia zhenghanii]MCF8602698.1 TetR/AcrR family transcriptional regulator [Gordonia zhenghanii]
MEKTTRERLLDAGLILLGRQGFRTWSTRAAEDLAGMPHGSARHHFINQRGMIGAMVQHLVELDLPREGETPTDQIRRWLSTDAECTRARYELVAASMHDDDLAADLVLGRDRFVESLVGLGMDSTDAREVVSALDGHVLDAVLRRRDAATAAADVDRIIGRFFKH